MTYFVRYIGLSTDVKPVLDEDVPLSLMIGSQFYETDTCNTYIWNGTDWEILLPVQFATRLENTAASPKVTFIGEALAGSSEGAAAWRIRKITETTHAGLDDDIAVEWCNGKASFTNLWNGHAGFDYS